MGLIQSLKSSKLITDGSVVPQSVELGTTTFENDGWLYAEIDAPYDFSYQTSRLFINNAVSNYRVGALGLVKSTIGDQLTSIWVPVTKGQSLKITQLIGNSDATKKTNCILFFYHN